MLRLVAVPGRESGEHERERERERDLSRADVGNRPPGDGGDEDRKGAAASTVFEGVGEERGREV